MKTTYELYIPYLPALVTRERSADGFGERIVERYRRVIFASVYVSTKKNIEETARIMGWHISETEKYLEARSKEWTA